MCKESFLKRAPAGVCTCFQSFENGFLFLYAGAYSCVESLLPKKVLHSQHLITTAVEMNLFKFFNGNDNQRVGGEKAKKLVVKLGTTKNLFDD